MFRSLFLLTLLLMATKSKKRKRHISHDGSIREWDYIKKEWILIETTNEKNKEKCHPKQLALEGRLFDLKQYFPYLYSNKKFIDFEDLNTLQHSFKINGNNLYIELKQSNKRKSNAQQHGDTGNNLWDSSILFAKCLEYNTFLIDEKNKDKLSQMLNVSNKNVMEIGAGTGFVGLAAAHCNAKNILLTDLNYCIENIQINVEKNKYLWNLNHHKNGKQKMTNPFENVSVFELDWSNPQKSMWKKNSLDVIIGTDVIWVKELVPILVNTLDYLYEHVMNKEDGIIIIAEQIRSSLVSELFWSKVKTKGFERTRVSPKYQHPDFRTEKIIVSILSKK